MNDSRLVMFRPFFYLFIVTAVTLLLSVFPIRASAHPGLGGTWNPGVLRYYYYGNKTYLPEMAIADDQWNAGISGIAYLHTTNSSLRDIAVKDVYVPTDDAWGWVSTNYLCSSCTYIASAGHEINYNIPSISTLSTGMQKKVVTHEMGHGLGLGHVKPKDYPSPAVMKQGTLNYKEPKPHDFADYDSSY